MRVGFPLGNTLVLNNIIDSAKQLKCAESHKRQYIRNIQNSFYGYHPLPYIICEPSPPWPHSIMMVLSWRLPSIMTALSLHYLHYLHDCVVDLVKLTPSTCIDPHSHQGVVYSSWSHLDALIHIHIKSGFIPTKEIYGSLYPLIHLSYWQKQNLIF